MKIMSVHEIQPEIKGAGEFHTASEKYPYEYNKRSYTHRLMCVSKGNCSFHYEKKSFLCDIGDIIYFPPNQPYGNEFYGQDFRVYNLFFDFYPYRTDSDIYSTACAAGRDMSRYMGETVQFSDCEFFNTLQRVISFPDALERITDIYREYSERRICYKQKASAMLTDLLISIYRFSENGAAAKDDSAINKILAYINQNYQLPLRGQTLSEIFNYHPSYINRLVQKATSMSLHTYIMDTKIRHAAAMLRETDMSVTEIALLFSFYDSSHFSSTFRQFTGCTPHEYRKHHQANNHGEAYL